MASRMPGILWLPVVGFIAGHDRDGSDRSVSGALSAGTAPVAAGATFWPAFGTHVPDHDGRAIERPLSTARTQRSDARPTASADADARDQRLLAAVAGGDRRAFEQLYLHYHARLTQFLGRCTTRRDLVEETVNGTLWAVWRNAAQFRGESKAGTWIFGIAYRCLMKALRDQPALPADSDAGPATASFGDEIPATESEGDQREVRDWVRRGLALLPAEQRTTIELAYFLGQSCEEIAAVMDCAVGTVKARMFHARLRLRNSLPALGGDVPGAKA